MSRALSSALLTVVAVPALLAVPVVGPLPAAAHPVRATLTATPLAGVDAAALAEVAPPVAAGATPGVAGQAWQPAKVTAAAVPRPVVLTPKRSAKRFDLVAVTWRHAAAAPGTTVQVRVREKGTWTTWQDLEQNEDAPDDGSREARAAGSAAANGARDGTVPLLTNGADGVQVRVDSPTGAAPAGLTLDLVDGGRSTADAGPGGPTGAAVAATPRPNVVTRAQWGADEKLVKAAPVVNSTVRTLVLHHTDTTNSYTAAQSYAQMRSVLAFHTKGRGWNDIGYNFLVDRYGRVFEGRRGSLTAPIMGAHSMGFNNASLGVSVLGAFTAGAPPQAAVNAVVDVMAWQAAQYQINPRGTSSVISGGGSAARYKAGTTVRVAGIVGHRDLGLTECPGNAFFPKLASIRAAVAARMVPGLIDPTLTGDPATSGTGGAGPAGPVTFTAAVPTRQRWAMTMAPLCGGAAVRTVTGTTSSRIGGTWDLNDATGRPVPPGAYTVTVTTRSPVGAAPTWRRDVEVLPTPASLFPAVPGPGPTPTGTPTTTPTVTSVTPATTVTPSGSPSVTPTPTPSGTPTVVPTVPPTTAPSTGCPVQRAAGVDPALTSVVAGRLARPDARTVVLVNATGTAAAFGEALAVAPFAVAQQAPLLLTGATALSDVVARDISARGATTAWLVGSTTSIAPSVEQQLRALGVTTLTRISGADKWATAAAIAQRVGAPAKEAVLVPGDPGELLDALVAAGSAAGAGRPVLLTSRTGVPTATLAALRAMKVTSVTVVGSTVAVPDKTLTALRTAGVTKHTRLVGKGRWATAAAIATAYAPKLPTDRVVLTSGLVAGPELLVASAQGRPVLLATTDVLPTNTADWLRGRPTLRVSVVAAPARVGTGVLRAVQDGRR